MTRSAPSQPWVESWFDRTTGTISHCIVDPVTRHCALVDPVLDLDYAAGRISTQSADRILEFTRTHGLTLDWLLETHAHADHLSAAQYLRSATGAPVAIGAGIIDVQRHFSTVFDAPVFSGTGAEFDRLLHDGEHLYVGDLDLTVLHTPGHTPACASYLVADCAFVGDTVFAPDFGTARCDFPGGDAATLFRSIARLYALQPATRLYLCHDYPPGGRPPLLATTVAEQRASNIHVDAHTREADFIAMRHARDAVLSAPALIWPSLQVNLRAGRLPEPAANGRRYLEVPIELAR